MPALPRKLPNIYDLMDFNASDEVFLAEPQQTDRVAPAGV
jgi:hypothetical protein